MRLCRLSLHHEGVLGIGHLVVSLLRRCITFCKECKDGAKPLMALYVESAILNLILYVIESQ